VEILLTRIRRDIEEKKREEKENDLLLKQTRIDTFVLMQVLLEVCQSAS